MNVAAQDAYMTMNQHNAYRHCDKFTNFYNHTFCNVLDKSDTECFLLRRGFGKYKHILRMKQFGFRILRNVGYGPSCTSFQAN